MKTGSGLFFVLPALLLLVVFCIYPMAVITYFSFFDENLISESVWVGLQNYYLLFFDEAFLKVFVNSLLFIFVTPLLIVVSLSLALLLKEPSRTNKISRFVLFLPVITPVVIAGIIWRFIFTEDTGLLNYLITSFGLKPYHWLTEYPDNILSVMLLVIWRGMGYYMMIFLAGLAVIDTELEEASILDGAGKFQRIYHIILPQLKPTIILVFVLSSASAIKIFTELFILIPGNPIGHKSIVYFLYREAFEKFNFGYSSAAGVILFLLTFGFSYINLRLLQPQE